MASSAPPSERPITPTLAQRWRLTHGLHQQGRVALEGTLAQVVALIAAAIRTGWPPFTALALVSALSLPVRLWDYRCFANAYAAFLAAPEETDPRAPDRWAMRQAMGIVFMAGIWGMAALAVLLRFEDGWLQTFTLLIQTGWIASACFRFARSPRLVTLLLSLTLGPSLLGVAVTAEGWMRLLMPIGMVHGISLRRTARAQADVIASLLKAEQEAAEANEKLRQLSLIDGLTGIANRRCFDETLESEWRRAARDQSSLALLMIDVDHFKRYNDQYGHQAGDACLRLAAQHIVVAARRPGDLVARYGGEEFAVILPETEAEDACRVAQRMITAFASSAAPHQGSPFGIVTISIGIAAVRPGAAGGMDVPALIRCADSGLYEAKLSGRNRLRVGGSDWAAVTAGGAAE